MNDKELDHIKSHQYDLVNTICYNGQLASFLGQQGHIGDADIEAMNVEYTNGGNTAAVCKLLNILKTRPGSYKSLLEGAMKLNQHGVVQILEKLTISDSRNTRNCNNSSSARSRESVTGSDGASPKKIHGTLPGKSITIGSIVIGTQICPLEWLVSIIKDFPRLEVLLPQRFRILANDLGAANFLKKTMPDYISGNKSHLEVFNGIIADWVNSQKSNALLLRFIGILDRIQDLEEWADLLRRHIEKRCEVLQKETGVIDSLKRLDIGCQTLPKMDKEAGASSNVINGSQLCTGPIIVGEKECPISKVNSILTSSDFLSRFHDLWSQFARELKIPEHKILQLRTNLSLTFQLSDVVCEIISVWAAASGKEATLQELIRVLVLEGIGMRRCAEALEKSFPPLCYSTALSNDQQRHQMGSEECSEQQAPSSSPVNSAVSPSLMKVLDAERDVHNPCLRSQPEIIHPILHLSVQRVETRKETLDKFKSSGVNFNSPDRHGDTVLAYAIRARRSEQFISDLIKDYGANPEHTNRRRENFLHISALHGTVDVLTLFLSRKELDVNTGNDDGNTPLHVAVIRVDEEVVLQLCQLLIKYGAKVNATNTWSQTVLHAATDCLLISLKVMEFLMEHLGERESDAIAKDDKGRTFLYVLVVKQFNQLDKIHNYICDRFSTEVIRNLYESV